MVLAIGNGPQFNYYFILIKDLTNLYLVQQMVLEPRLFSRNDHSARIAVNLTSGVQAGMAVRPKEKTDPIFIGNKAQPHPTFFMVIKK